MSQTEYANVHQSCKDIIMVLLGINSEDKCTIGNAIVQEDCFDAENEMRAKLKQVDDQLVYVINTPDKLEWLNSKSKDPREELKPSYPGPRVFLLVLQEDKLTQKEAELFRQLKVRFGETMVENTIIVLISERGESFKELYERADEKLKKLVDECRNRVCVHKKDKGINNTELIKQIMEICDQMQKLDHESTNTASDDDNLYKNVANTELMKQMDENKEENVQASSGDYITMVLLGKNNKCKCLIGNIIFGKEKFHSEEVTCETNMGKVANESVSIIKTPYPFNSDPMIDSIELLKPSYAGPRVFLLILKENKVSPEEKEMFTQLKQRFGEQMVGNTIVLCNKEMKLSSGSMDKSSVTFKRVSHKQLLEECGNRFYLYNKQTTKNELVKQLMYYTKIIMEKNRASQSVEERTYNNISPANIYMKTMLTPALNIISAEEIVQQSRKVITMVLVGINSEDKCMIGNAILQEDCFDAEKEMDIWLKQGDDQSICIINTPDHFHLLTPKSKATREELNPSYAGPRVFLLVLQEVTRTQTEVGMFKQLKARFGETMVENTVIVLVSHRDESLGLYERADEKLKQLLHECRKRVCIHKKNKGINDTELIKQIMRTWDEMQKQDYESTSIASDDDNMSEMIEDTEPMEQELKCTEENVRASSGQYTTVMLLGKSNKCKCLIGNIIIETEPFRQEIIKCEINMGKVEDENVVIIKTPYPFNSDPITDSIEMLNPSYTGSHVFLLVLKENKVSSKELEMFNQLKQRFGEQMVENTIVLCNTETKMSASLKEITFKNDSHKQLLEECGNRVCFYNKQTTKGELVKHLKGHIKEIMEKNQASQSEQGGTR
ncbi:GTPase IMAP family member 8-like [Paramisgurnus dabryanus]|uniref:GTPase IMAP family member 8-like n=1 Tax=Paramisgurnus dabryanus TaxID=90735 RepID=UPI0031F46D79